MRPSNRHRHSIRGCGNPYQGCAENGGSTVQKDHSIFTEKKARILQKVIIQIQNQILLRQVTILLVEMLKADSFGLELMQVQQLSMT